MAPERTTGGLASMWTDTCRALGATDGESIARNWEVLRALYAHPARAYHNLDHIAECLDACRHGAAALPPDRLAEVRLAIFMHDCIYDSRRRDNEARSAAVATMIARDMGISGNRIAAVARMVMATTHAGETDKVDEGLVRDADLVSLAAPPERFEANTLAIRQEHAWATDEQFRAGRLAFFRDMLGRSSIYALPRFRARFEPVARDNIARAIQDLERRERTDP